MQCSLWFAGPQPLGTQAPLVLLAHQGSYQVCPGEFGCVVGPAVGTISTGLYLHEMQKADPLELGFAEPATIHDCMHHMIRVKQQPNIFKTCFLLRICFHCGSVPLFTRQAYAHI